MTAPILTLYRLHHFYDIVKYGTDGSYSSWPTWDENEAAALEDPLRGTCRPNLTVATEQGKTR